MRPETIDTITRHLKGIVAALEKEKEKLPRVWTFKGVKLEQCTNDQILDAVELHYDLGSQPHLTSIAFRSQSEALDLEVKRRGLQDQAKEIALKAAK